MKFFSQGLAFIGGLFVSLLLWGILTAAKLPLLLYLGLGAPLLSYYGKSSLWYHFSLPFIHQVYLIIAVVFLVANSLVLWLIPSLSARKGLLLGYFLLFLTAFQLHSLREKYLDPGRYIGHYFYANQTLEQDIVDALKKSTQKRCDSMSPGEFRARCVAVFARENNDPQICLTLSKEITPHGRSETDDCLWDLIHSADPETACSLMINPEKSGNCFSFVYGQMNYKNRTSTEKQKPHFPQKDILELCTKINEDNPYEHQRIACINQVAAAYNDPGVCTLMPSPSEKDLCYYHVSMIASDPVTCQKISYSVLRNRCQTCSSPNVLSREECEDDLP